MADLTRTDEDAVERLSFQMMKELYLSAISAMAKMNPDTTRLLFLGSERLITDAIARIVATEAEGPNSLKVAIAVGERVAEVLDQAHRQTTVSASDLCSAADAAQMQSPAEADMRRRSERMHVQARPGSLAA